LAEQAQPIGPARTRIAYIGLGSNVGNGPVTLARAIEALAREPALQLTGVSRLYRTRPVGVTEQPHFVNAVARFVVRFRGTPVEGAEALLATLKATERALGRRPRRRWGPREIDLDLLAFGRECVVVPAVGAGGPPRLSVPHPEAAQRLFVLAPWAELAPRLVPPGWREGIDAARRRRERLEGPDAVAPIGEWRGDSWELSA
jgi:2-amino-4-hydroxy-6-hydroxymethyldihydropteridine diphosphokinase